MRVRLVSPGLWATLLLGASGVWVMVAPRAVGFQAVGLPWSAGTRDDVVVGAVLLGAGVLGAFAHLVLGLRDALRRASAVAEGGSSAAPARTGAGPAEAPPAATEAAHPTPAA